MAGLPAETREQRGELAMGDTAAVPAGAPEIPLSKLIGALSYALDMAEGEQPGHATRSCLISMRVAEELGMDADARSDLFYAALLKDAGCSANSARMAALFGTDDQTAKRSSKRVDWASPLFAFLWALRTVSPRGSLAARAERLMTIHDEGKVTQSLMQARCDRGAEIALMLGFPRATAEAIRALDEHWNGQGQPRGLRETEIPLAGRILCLAQTVEVFHASGGVGPAYRIARRRSGQWFDPALVDLMAAFRRDSDFWSSLAAPDLSAVEPPERFLTADERRLDQIAGAFARVIDAKSPWTHRHSDRVRAVATNIARLLGLEGPAVRDLSRAAQLHDIGKLAISNRILDKPERLTDAEFAKIKEHPVLTQRILERVPGLGELASLAGAHHERLDGQGYPRGLTADELTMPMRILAVADVYDALTAERPYRAAYRPEHALEIMRTEVPRRLDHDAFATLEAVVEGRKGGPELAASRDD